VSNYSIRIEVLRQVSGDDIAVKVVRVTAEKSAYCLLDFVLVEMFPALQRYELRNPSGVYGLHPWPADWPTDTDFTQIEYEADLVSLATRLAVEEWQRRQEGGQ
jgi:hypothetical protein